MIFLNNFYARYDPIVLADKQFTYLPINATALVNFTATSRMRIQVRIHCWQSQQARVRSAGISAVHISLSICEPESLLALESKPRTQLQRRYPYACWPTASAHRDKSFSSALIPRSADRRRAHSVITTGIPSSARDQAPAMHTSQAKPYLSPSFIELQEFASIETCSRVCLGNSSLSFSSTGVSHMSFPAIQEYT